MTTLQTASSDIYQKIYQEVSSMPIEQAREVLDFAQFLHYKSQYRTIQKKSESSQADSVANKAYFDTSKMLSVDELIEMVGVETKHQSTIEEMDESIDEFF